MVHAISTQVTAFEAARLSELVIAKARKTSCDFAYGCHARFLVAGPRLRPVAVSDGAGAQPVTASSNMTQR